MLAFRVTTYLLLVLFLPHASFAYEPHLPEWVFEDFHLSSNIRVSTELRLSVCVCVCVCARARMHVHSITQSCPTLCSYALQPTRFLWNFPGKNTEVVAISYSRLSSLSRGQTPCLLPFLHWQTDSLPLRHLGSQNSDDLVVIKSSGSEITKP